MEGYKTTNKQILVASIVVADVILTERAQGLLFIESQHFISFFPLHFTKIATLAVFISVL